jgi:hypothetical protein
MRRHDLIVRQDGPYVAVCSCEHWAADGNPTLQELIGRHAMHAEEAAISPDPLTDGQVQEISGRLDAAEPAIWGAHYNSDHNGGAPHWEIRMVNGVGAFIPGGYDEWKAQADLIVNAPDDIRVLLQDRELADAAIARLNKRVNDDLANANTLMRESYAYKLEAEKATAQVQAIRDAASAWDLTDDEIAMFCNDNDPYQRARLWTIYQTRKAAASEIRNRLTEATDTERKES